MAYNFFPTGYQNYYSPQPAQIVPGQNNAQNALIWVNGEVGAKSYLVAPNSTVVLWDTESQTVYIKSADASGMPSIKTLDYTMRSEGAQKADIQPVADFATKDDVLRIQKEIDALRADMKPKKSKASEE